ncbi:zinc finger BED domain-containing protein RICESLEEPER 2-like [Carex rostrata]
MAEQESQVAPIERQVQPQVQPALIDAPETGVERSKCKRKRKVIRPRSEVWIEFTKFKDNDGNEKARCNFCEKEFFADSNRNGTTNLKAHMPKCKGKEEKKQTLLSFEQNLTILGAGGQKTSTIINWRFEQDAIRQALACMVILDELPFSFVEGEGFKKFVAAACPRFRIPSRTTVTRDCFEVFTNEGAKLKNYFKLNKQRVCLTTDTWTSLQKINYMCLTAHFIDSDWKLNKRIINFCPVSSHSGKEIGMAIEKCLFEWEIDQVFTVTVDNASSNDLAIDYLKKKITNWGTGILNGKHLHMRCIAHIINLVVQDGLKEMSTSVARIRGAVKYVKQSPKRLHKFKECVKMEKIDSKALLCLDCPTRWNSTYLMLDVALKFKKAFETYAEQDQNFISDLANEKTYGAPTDSDWVNARKIVVFLKHFYNLTNRISGSSYVTANIFFHEITNVECLLRKLKMSSDVELSVMADKMVAKYNKYWGNIEKANSLIYVADILDPRHKLEFMDFALKELYGQEKSGKMIKKVTNDLVLLFDEYKRLYGLVLSEKGLKNVTPDEESMGIDDVQVLTSMFKKHKSDTSGEENKSELEKYLKDDLEVDEIDFDILGWWKINAPRFSILSHMARDVLAIPVSTVASESTFSTGGRILDAFRSSLTPRIAQSLICSEDWLRSTRPIGVEENLEMLDQLEEEFSKVGLESAASTPN